MLTVDPAMYQDVVCRPDARASRAPSPTTTPPEGSGRRGGPLEREAGDAGASQRGARTGSSEGREGGAVGAPAGWGERAWRPAGRRRRRRKGSAAAAAPLRREPS